MGAASKVPPYRHTGPGNFLATVGIGFFPLPVWQENLAIPSISANWTPSALAPASSRAPIRAAARTHPPSKATPPPPRCNRILKDCTVQSAQKLHLYGPPEIIDRITRWNAEGRHGIFAAARHHLRLVRTLVKNQTAYLAPTGPGSQATP
jgi:hypothetical protein